MALVVADRVKETTTTTGTGAITLAGAETNFVTFSSVLSNADTTYYAIVDNTNSAFEVGLGTYASSGNTITRTTIISSSNSNNAVDLQAGSKDVFVTLPSNKFPLLDASGNVDINGGTIDGTTIGGSSAAAGTFTTFTSAGIDDNASSTSVTVSSGGKVTIDPAGSTQGTHELSVREADSPRISIDDINGSDTDVNASLLLRAGVTNKGVVGYSGSDDLRLENKTAAGSTILATNDIDRLTVDSSGAVAIGGTTFIGSRANSLSVVGDDNSSTIASKTTAYDTVFSVLPWSSSTTYLATGTYFDDGSWIHASDNATSSLVALTGDGVHWYASSGSTPNFDVANNAPLWNATGQWDGDINTTYAINTGNITSAGTGTFQAASGPILYLKDTSGTGATSHNSWISFRDSGNTELGYVGYGSTSNTILSVSNYSNGPVQLDGTSITLNNNTSITGTLNVSSIPAGSANWRPIIFNDGGTLASNASVEIHGTLGYLTAVYLNSTHTQTTRNSDTIFYSSTDSYHRKNTAAGMKSSLGLTAAGYIDTATGNYGTVKVDDDRGVSWAGYAIRDDWVFMSNGAPNCGIYNDTDNEWAIKITRNAQTSIYHNGAQKGYTYDSGWRVTGNLLATSDVYAYYSDERLKDKTGNIENALDKVGAIETFYYTHNDKAIELGYEDKKQQVGVSAQSVEAVMPEVVHLAPIDDDGEGNSVSGEDYKTVNYARLVPLLIESIKELRAEIEELKRG